MVFRRERVWESRMEEDDKWRASRTIGNIDPNVGAQPPEFLRDKIDMD